MKVFISCELLIYSWLKIPTMDMDVKLIPIGIACAVAVYLAQANVSIIFTGGIGKNGSTVAVRHNCSSINLTLQYILVD